MLMRQMTDDDDDESDDDAYTLSLSPSLSRSLLRDGVISSLSLAHAALATRGLWGRWRDPPSSSSCGMLNHRPHLPRDTAPH